MVRNSGTCGSILDFGARSDALGGQRVCRHRISFFMPLAGMERFEKISRTATFMKTVTSKALLVYLNLEAASS
jgi:hypothetical protein